ncbi:YEATS family domain-containing protein [Ditylenchus destructor]|uniref:YEATS family domain-containing protein n=1 Tax=Ditylenchus destructor TaxID=166010 RepID=A0AAD4NJN4_9BILA|nr:YEATS family domain-containing protein [Ditylenchus destructor]
MADPGVVVTERIRNQKIVKPVIYGNSTVRLPHKLENGHTHRWTVYFRPYYDEDISKYIRKVQFKLHESIENPVRVLDAPPFEITETGWGEFEVQIKLYFQDVNEKSVTAFLYLRLFQPLVTLDDGTQMVVNEYYDEIVFNEPTEQMYKAMISSANLKQQKSKQVEKYSKIKKQLKEKLEGHNKEILAEIEDLRSSLRDALELIQKTQKELENDSPATVSTEATEMEVL